MTAATDQFPPDVRAKIEQANRARGGSPGGIGGRAPENASSAAARSAALGVPQEHGEESLEAHPETLPEPKSATCKRCGTTASEAHNFCARCGNDLMQGDFAARLGIKFTDSDVEDYIFRGFVVREIKVYGAHAITVKSSQPTDSTDVDNHVMNGAWRKNPQGEQKPVSEILTREQQQLALTASLVLKLDGKSIGDTFDDRIKYLIERGSAFVDLVSKKSIWFNRALTDHLQRADAFEGS